MSEILTQNAQLYASRHGLRLAERLGFGIHGIVPVVEDNSKPGKAAIKVHGAAEPYLRERQVYERLRDAGISGILGFHVPQMIRSDDERWPMVQAVLGALEDLDIHMVDVSPSNIAFCG